MSAPASPRRQQGVALLILAVILVLGVSAFLVSSLNSATLDEPTRTRNRNAEALQEAKRALIGYIAKEVLDLSENVPGRLPCPESPSDAGTTLEGRAGSPCTPTAPTNKTIGRLPWRTLGIDKLVDASNEPLWYAVSPNWVYSGTYPVINSGTVGQLTVDGTGDVVAVIIAPGRPLNVSPSAAQIAVGCQARQQARTDRSHIATGGNPDHRDYVECQNASSPIDTTFGVAIPGDPGGAVLNDQMVYITAKDILNAIQGPVAERMQRTVAPLLREYSGLWPGGNFLPYAAEFKTPEDGSVLVSKLCGPATPATQVTEGLLPIAPNSGADCISTWNNFSITGSVTPVGGASGTGCSPAPPSPPTSVTCTFLYYKLVGLGLVLFGGGVTSTDVTIQAIAPHAAASFRTPLRPADVIVPAGLTAQAATFTPQTNGDARLSLVVRITGTELCDNLLLGLVCNLLPGLLASPVSTSVEFPQLAATTTLQGTKLSAAVRAAYTGGPPYNLLAPISTEPHYWFMQNEWYRYTYYAVSPNASAAATGGDLTVNGFPTANGSSNDKRFVLAVMGPAVTGQARGAAAALNQYVEGANAASGASPRVFAYQVFTASGNDRIATCPFNDGAASQCD